MAKGLLSAGDRRCLAAGPHREGHRTRLTRTCVHVHAHRGLQEQGRELDPFLFQPGRPRVGELPPLSHQHRRRLRSIQCDLTPQRIFFFPSSCPDYAISKPDLMSQMERGERPPMQEQEDSEEGETPADPSAGEWLPWPRALPSRSSARGVTGQRKPRTETLASRVQEGGSSAGAGPAAGLRDGPADK